MRLCFGIFPSCFCFRWQQWAILSPWLVSLMTSQFCLPRSSTVTVQLSCCPGSELPMVQPVSLPGQLFSSVCSSGSNSAQFTLLAFLAPGSWLLRLFLAQIWLSFALLALGFRHFIFGYFLVKISRCKFLCIRRGLNPLSFDCQPRVLTPTPQAFS